MTIQEIITYLQDEMPDEMAPETLAAFILTIVTGYLGYPEAAVRFLRAVVESSEKNMDKIMEDFNDVAGEP